ncbi:hypothetical protein I0C86_41365 [Plantactinospora sp. S1510]|uniref:Terminase small subunit n=1 Tax=Plantactinospora alkalitolerans TaxID=2789879 RepID=A0ABS0H9Z2_9ACTN|nr:hypothetical protein [Plantactinospora alkalitolerans]MBF9135303.1 hypothetical protein [Plantactinospora alkalitolerans]
MAYSGRPPKDNKHGRGYTVDWNDVPAVDYTGPSPDLPEYPEFEWNFRVREWWEMVRRMPHCALWSEMDWDFALVTAFMWQDWWRNYFSDETVHANKSTEIRRREDQIGTTAEARRKLRIRYVEPAELAKSEPEATPAAGGAKVTNIQSRRNRLAG